MKITDYGYNGEGVGHEAGKVCFVPYTIIGEEVDYHKVKETSSFIKARVDKITYASAKRQSPPCPYFGKCGGCDFQHLSYADELEVKKGILSRHLAKVGYSGEIEVFPSQQYGYRNKIKLFSFAGGLGLKKAESNEVVAIRKCLLIDEKLNEILGKLQEFVKGQRLNDKLDTLTLRRVNESLLVWFKYSKKAKIDYTWLDFILGDNVSIYHSFAEGEEELVKGKRVSHDFGFNCEVPVDAFRQVNDEICERLYDNVIQSLQGDNILNAYSGGGILSALIARKVKGVTGVELGKAEHEMAETLKENNGIRNLTNIQGDCAQVIPKLETVFDTVVVDPPRAGCDKKVCQALNESKAKRIVYISCNPASLVRDISLLSNYDLKAVKLFDMFPRTANFECLAIFDLKSAYKS